MKETNGLPTVERLDPGRFAALGREWNDLLDRSAAATPFLRWEWMHAWWSVFGRDDELFLLAVRRDGALVGLAPLVRSASRGVRRLSLIGDGVADHLDVIAARGEEPAVGAALGAWLTANASDWDAVRFAHLRPAAGALTLVGVAGSATLRPTDLVRVVRPAGDITAYLETRPGLKYRRNFSKKVRRLMDEEKAVLRRVESAGVPDAVRAFVRMHERRSMQMGRRSAFFDARVRAFLETALPRLQDAGLLRLVFLDVRGQPAACFVGFEFKNRLSLYQSGIDPDWMHLSDGAVLTFLLIKDAFERRIDEVDFLTGEEGYKDLWATDRVEQSALSLYRPSLQGAAAKAADAACRLRLLTVRKITGLPVIGRVADLVKRALVRRPR